MCQSNSIHRHNIVYNSFICFIRKKKFIFFLNLTLGVRYPRLFNNWLFFKKLQQMVVCIQNETQDFSSTLRHGWQSKFQSLYNLVFFITRLQSIQSRILLCLPPIVLGVDTDTQKCKSLCS